jgi:hypothetical protein
VKSVVLSCTEWGSSWSARRSKSESGGETGRETEGEGERERERERESVTGVVDKSETLLLFVSARVCSCARALGGVREAVLACVRGLLSAGVVVVSWEEVISVVVRE